MKKPYVPVTVSINRCSSKGFGVGSAQKTSSSPLTKTIVPFTIPGDLVLAEIGSKKKGAYVGKLLQVTEASLDRREAVCKHASSCGGCVWQVMDYAKQLFYKEFLVKELFTPLFSGEIRPMIPCKDSWRYRNKMEYTFSQNKAGEKFLGLMMAATKGRVQTLEECHLAPSWFIQVLSAVKTWWDESDLLAFHALQDKGSLRTLTVREGKRTGQKMVILTVSGNPDYAIKKESLEKFVAVVKAVLGDGTLSIFLRIHQAVKGMPTQFYEMQLQGPDHIQERLEIQCENYKKEYTFKISPTAFFQPNTIQAERLYSQALEIAGMKPRECVLDLYAGTATLGMIFSSFAKKVVSIEINPYAVFDAESNKELNLVDNLQVFKGDVAQVLKDLRKKDPIFKNPDLIVLDPPRTGLSLEAVQVVIEAAPKEILYISCAPKEQARDCLLLKDAGYEIVTIQPLDQFPHTMHIENIVLLSRKPTFFS